MRYANLNKRDLLGPVLTQVPVVDVEVVQPLMQQPPGVVSKVLLERILSDLDNLASENGNR